MQTTTMFHGSKSTWKKNRTNSELFQRKGLGYYGVWTLRKPYLDNHCHFFFDNFFTSAELMRDLESRDM